MSLILIGPMPPPIDGQSVAFGMLVEGCRERDWPHAVIDIARPGDDFARGRLQRASDYLRAIPGYIAKLFASTRPTVYLTMAQSLSGGLRDAVFVGLARLRGARIVVHLHGGNYDGLYAAQGPWTQTVIRWFLHRTDVIIVLGERLRAMFDFDPTLAARLAVVPNGLPAEISLRTAPKELPTESPIRLLFLSNLVESKGYLVLLEALDILVNEKNLDVEAVFCGEFRVNPGERGQVQSAEHGRALFDRQIARANLGERVRYEGIVRGPEKVAALEAAHFFVLPTNYDNEGQPISILEAMAAGCVVVSTDYRGIPELVEDGQSGWLVPEPDARAVAEKISRSVADAREFRRLSAAAIERCTAQFTRERHLERLLPLLETGQA